MISRDWGSAELAEDRAELALVKCPQGRGPHVALPGHAQQRRGEGLRVRGGDDGDEVVGAAELSDGEEDEIREGVKRVLSDALQRAEESPTPDPATLLDGVFATLTGRSSAVVASRDGRPEGVLTRSDLLEYLAHARSQAS